MTVVWEEHGLTQAEYERLRAALGREPNRVELGIAGALWSEHCSYKSSKIWLRRLPIEGEHVVQGPGENAGIVRLDGPWCIAFKIESHNHPSYIEPYHGAATGVGGILRDVFTMGARPLANLNALRFGAPDHPRTPFLLDGVVRGIADYGNCVGVPTVAGETVFAPCYNGNILVNAMTVGVVHEAAIFRGTASGVGNPVFYVGSATGADGIHGATMASAAFDDDVEDQRPAVQVGDPFTEKLLLEACLELMAAGCVVGIQDMGAAGLASSSFEMASRAGSGLELHLDRVPLRQEGLGPYEIMLSESQERMLVVLERGKEELAYEIFRRWELAVVEIGRVTDTGLVRCYWHGEVAAELPVRLIVDEAPQLERPYREPTSARERRTAPPPEPPSPWDPAADLRALLAHPTLASKHWIWEQYDHTVGGNTVRAEGGDAAVLHVPEAGRAIAVTVEGNARLVALDPYIGAQWVVVEGVRNLASVGAVPLGATDCLNFGNPEDPETFWGFVRAVEGLAEGLRRTGVPIVSGNVSLYNETSGVGIWPTPILGFVGRVEVPLERLPEGRWCAGDRLWLVGNPATSLAGSAYAEIRLGEPEPRGPLPEPAWAELAALQAFVRELLVAGDVHLVTDVAEGGPLVAVAEAALAAGIGAVLLPETPLAEPIAAFGELGQMVVVAGPPSLAEPLAEVARTHGLPVAVLGSVGGDALVGPGWRLPLAELEPLWRDALPRLVHER